MKRYNKICAICGGAVANVAKVTTCQNCRHRQRLARLIPQSRREVLARAAMDAKTLAAYESDK